MFALVLALVFAQINAEKSNPDCSTASCVSCNSGSDKCVECKTNYILSDGICIHKSEAHCDQVYQGNCEQCETGYQLDATTKRCVEGDYACQQYNADGTCSSCSFNYKFVDGVCTQCAEVAHCSAYDDNCTCTDCFLNYHPSVDHLCETQDIYCINYRLVDEAYQCDSCVTGYY
ncbi:hypothetical protein EIN_220820, partial [Entamoeba invadens IP1]